MLIRQLEPALPATLSEQTAQLHAGRRLLSHHGGPIQRGFQRHGSSLETETVEVRGGYLRDQHLQLWSGFGGYRPLDKAQIAGSGHAKLPGEPVLLLDPLDGCHAIAVLFTGVRELITGAGGTAAALDEHLIAAFGIGACGKGAEEAA